MAMEMAWEVDHLVFTQPMTLWVEYAVGFTALSSDFIRACEEVAER